MGIMDKASEFLNSEQGEQHSDSALQQGQDAINNATDGKFAGQVGQGAAFVDGKIGNDTPAEGPGAEQGN